MTYSETIINRLNDMIFQKRITVNRLAILSGISQSTLENIIKGKSKNPSLKTLHRISQGLGITVSQLLDFPEINETVFEDE